MPIFDPATWNAVKVSEADRKIAVAQYERAVQTSFREVADALAARGTIDRQVAAQESLVHASSETYRLSTARYVKGVDSYLSVLDAQRSLYAQQQESGVPASEQAGEPGETVRRSRRRMAGFPG